MTLDEAIQVALETLAGSGPPTGFCPDLALAYKVLAANHSPEDRFTNGIGAIAAAVHRDNVERGFFDDRDSNNPHHLLAMLMLIVTELAEITEEVRKPGTIPMSEKIPDFTTEEEEMADTIIRCLDYSDFRQLRIGGAIKAKRAFNKTRGHRHGGKRA